MLKKSLSLLLALIMCLCFAMPGFAVDEAETLNEQQALEAVNSGVAALVDVDADSVAVDEDLADKIIADSDTPEEIARSIAQFVFIDKSEVEGLSDAIVADSKYTVTVTKDGRDTVYIAVSIIDHPEIYDARVFLKTVEKLSKKSDEIASAGGVDISSGKYDPMTYSHIAGELSLHMITLDLTRILGGDSWNTVIKEYYDHAAIADLNIDEGRVSADFIEFLGRIISLFLDILFG